MSNEVLRQEFEMLMAKDPNGLLQPEAVVKAAEKPSHALHNYFEWDDEAAAARYRLQQANWIIRHYKIVIPELNIKVRALTSLQLEEDKGGFRWLNDVVADTGMRARLLEIALQDLERMENKYAHLVELSSVWEAAHKIGKRKNRK